MNTTEAIYARHSVRQFLDKPIESGVRDKLNALVAAYNHESGLSMSIVFDDPEGFDSKMAHYGNFTNVSNYIVLAGKRKEDIDERCGYYGEKLVLEAQKMGLNTCWVYLTFNKNRVKKLIRPDEKLAIVIALGYGENEGKPHNSKSLADITGDLGEYTNKAPDWFNAGMDMALLAPTAVNQQKFKIGIKDDKPVFTTGLIGTCLKIDLGIVKYHFEVGSGKKIEVE